MEPVINPLFFYIVDVADALKILLGFGGGAVFIITLLVFIIEATNGLDYIETEEWKVYKTIFIVSGIAIILGILLPSEATCYKMIVASFLTPGNLDLLGDGVTNAVDYIVESVDKIITAKQ